MKDVHSSTGEALALTDPCRSPGRRALRAGLALLIASWTVWVVLVCAAAHTSSVDFEPLNGSFQSFQPVRRLLAGQWPGQDFDTYLGLGPTYVLSATMAFVGPTFHDSKVATYALSGLLHALTIVFLVRASGRSWLVATAAGAIGAALASAPGAFLGESAGQAVFDATRALATPGNSLLGVRCAAPLVAAIVLLGLRALARTSTRTGVLARAWPSGLAAGLVLGWSNDYGPATAFATIGVSSVLDALAQANTGQASTRLATTWRARLADTLSTVIVASVVAVALALLLVTLATGGAVTSWFETNVVGVAQDQRWFFFHGPRGSAWQPLGTWPYVVGASACALALFVAQRTGRAGDRAIAIVVVASFVAAVVAARASAETRYFHPLFRALWVLVPVWTWRVVTCVPRARSSPRLVPLVSWTIALVSGVALARAHAHANSEVERLRPLPASVCDAPEAGGPLPTHLGKVLWIGREIRAECDARALPPDRRVFSTYSTMLDLVAGAFQPTGDDYVIHALGARARERYVSRLREFAPPYASTIRADASGFEGWVRKQCWPVYAELIAHYDPYERLPYAVVWRRRAQARPPSDVPVDLVLDPPDERGRVRLVAAIDARFAERGPQIVEIEIDAARGLLPDATPPPFGRDFVVGIDLQTASVGGRFGIAPDARRVVFPLVVVPGTPTVSRLAALGGDPVRVDAARARVVIDERALDEFALTRLVARDYTDDEVEHGVLRAGEARFLVVDPTDLWGIAPGTRLAFAHSGERRVRAVEGAWVTVEGAALSPTGDGFPNAIGVLAP